LLPHPLYPPLFIPVPFASDPSPALLTVFSFLRVWIDPVAKFLQVYCPVSSSHCSPGFCGRLLSTAPSPPAPQRIVTLCPPTLGRPLAPFCKPITAVTKSGTFLVLSFLPLPAPLTSAHYCRRALPYHFWALSHCQLARQSVCLPFMRSLGPGAFFFPPHPWSALRNFLLFFPPPGNRSCLQGGL